MRGIILNNPVNGQLLIIEISRYTFKKSVVYCQHFTPGLESSAHNLLAAVRSLCFTLALRVTFLTVAKWHRHTRGLTDATLSWNA